MTYTLAICDDEESIIFILQKYIQEIIKEEGMEVLVETYQNPRELLETIKKQSTRYDLVFLDIDMPELNGLEVGKGIKETNEFIIITFVTAHDKYALKAFGVGAFNYLVKPIKKDQLRDTLVKSIRLLCKIKGDEQGYITIQDKGKYIKIPYKDIIFFEKYKNKVLILCEDCKYEAYLTFKRLKEILGNDLFVQCHRGAMVHKNKIIRLEDNMVIIDDYKIPVSKNYLKQMKETFFVNRLQ